MLRRRKRYSVLARMPGAVRLLARQGGVPWGAASGLGLVAPTLMSRALAEASSAALDIVLFLGPALELWNPLTLQANGMGGSETMAWELGRRLVALGHRVRVFGHCSGLEGVFEGVEWLDYSRFRGLGCDVLISSRQPAAVDAKHDVEAKLRLLWLHEAHCGDKLTPDRDQRIDAYLCLSEWHAAAVARYYPFIAAEKLVLLRNGIDVADFAAREGEVRDTRRAVYSSSPDRGLQIALDTWPAIVAEVPGATLHVYYGFENWLRVAQLAEDAVALAAIAKMKRQLSSTAGVVYHGRMNPAELAREYRLSGVWAYPDFVPETSCLSAMQAQAAGLKIVTSALGALNETVGERGTLLTENPLSPEYAAAFVRATIAALRAGEAEVERAALREHAASHFDLPSLARDFESIIRTRLASRLDIVVFTGPALEPWNPDTLLQNGMGGSETMVWEIGRHLAALGHRVRVFGDCQGLEGTFQGVEWLDYRRFRDKRCDVLLSSRQPAVVDDALGVQAKLRLLWVHDVHCGERLTPERDARFDAYLCLSAWHVACFGQHHPFIRAAKILQLRNGIEPEQFRLVEGEVRDPLRAVYSSCPSRGLQVALDAWPQVRERVPEATLHVYYGFETWQGRASTENDTSAPAAIAAMKEQIARTAGVVFHGRISPDSLSREFRGSGVWVYPNSFHETSCITAMQAQAAGLQIVTSALAALNETVAERGVLLTQDPKSDEYRRAFIEATIDALRVSASDARREQLSAYAAEHFALGGVARDFEALFHGLLERSSPLVASRLDGVRS